MTQRIANALQRITRATATLRIRAEEQAAKQKHGKEERANLEDAMAVHLEHVADSLEAALV